VIFAAGGAVGSQAARVFAREGARVFLSGRRLAPVAAVAEEINATGDRAEAAEVDALDEQAVGAWVERSRASRAGSTSASSGRAGPSGAGRRARRCRGC